MQAIQFGVITKVPDGDGITGNLACPIGDIYIVTGKATEANDYKEPVKQVGLECMAMRTPVFTLGEILVGGCDHRELAGRGRKPGKWDVECEWFDTVEEAVAKAEEVMIH